METLVSRLRSLLLDRLPRSALAVSGVIVLLLAGIAIGKAVSRSDFRSGRDRWPELTPGSVVPEPANLFSKSRLLKLKLGFRSRLSPTGTAQFAYFDSNGFRSPTLRVQPGDTVALTLKNDLIDLGSVVAGRPMCRLSAPPSGLCAGDLISALSTNLHFHGLTIPPVCHQDDVLSTSLQPDDAPFEYRFRIPDDEPPGLYWYHPHVHGYSAVEVAGGASGAIIVEGIERAVPEIAGLPERVMVIRDQALLNPNAPPSKSEPVTPKMLIDHDGDAVNTGTGFGKPARDLSINFVPVPYPDYPPSIIRMKPGERQFWRVVNAASVTYLNLAVIVGRTPQNLGLVAIDGVPMKAAGGGAAAVTSVNHIGVPPGGRVEFIVTGPPAGTQALFVTRTVDTGTGGENDPNRALATIASTDDAPEPSYLLPATSDPLPPPSRPWIGDVTPTRVRRLYFSEQLQNPNAPNSPTTFYLTVDGQTPQPFDPSSSVANLVTQQGDVEDWIIENRSNELHDFHIHQIHFQLRDWNGMIVNEPFLRDTVNLPYYNGHSLTYPSVRLRLDFRDPNTVGTFPYHCHLLEHEDGGMMGTIRVEPAAPAR